MSLGPEKCTIFDASSTFNVWQFHNKVSVDNMRETFITELSHVRRLFTDHRGGEDQQSLSIACDLCAMA